MFCWFSFPEEIFFLFFVMKISRKKYLKTHRAHRKNVQPSWLKKDFKIFLMYRVSACIFMSAVGVNKNKISKLKFTFRREGKSRNHQKSLAHVYTFLAFLNYRTIFVLSDTYPCVLKFSRRSCLEIAETRFLSERFTNFIVISNIDNRSMLRCQRKKVSQGHAQHTRPSSFVVVKFELRRARKGNCRLMLITLPELLFSRAKIPSLKVQVDGLKSL